MGNQSGSTICTMESADMCEQCQKMKCWVPMIVEGNEGWTVLFAHYSLYIFKIRSQSRDSIVFYCIECWAGMRPVFMTSRASLLFLVKEYYNLWKGIVITIDLESVDYYDWNQWKLERYMYHSHQVFWRYGQEWESLLFRVKEYHNLWKGIVITID